MIHPHPLRRAVARAPVLTIGMAAWLLAGSTATAGVRVTIHDGLVSVAATDATVREILTEWARVGQTNVVNLERIPGGPISIELTAVSEERALDVLLRSASGYLAVLRPIPVSNLSRFDRVVVMPTSVAPQPPAAAGAPPMTFQKPRFEQPIAPEEKPDDQRSSPSPAVPTPARRRPVFNAYPRAQIASTPGGIAAPPSAPLQVVAIPGMVTPGPQQSEPSTPASGTPDPDPRARR